MPAAPTPGRAADTDAETSADTATDARSPNDVGAVSREQPDTPSASPVRTADEPSSATRTDVSPPPAIASTASGNQPMGDAEAALDRLRRGWAEVVAHVGRNPANRPLFAACRPVEVQGYVAVLGFPEDQAFLRDIADRKRPAL